jgi:hypothetical protein
VNIRVNLDGWIETPEYTILTEKKNNFVRSSEECVKKGQVPRKILFSHLLKHIAGLSLNTNNYSTRAA